MFKIYLLFLVTCLWNIAPILAQDTGLVDSLLMAVKTAKANEKLTIYNELAYHFHTTDSILSLEYAEKVKRLATTQNDKKNLATAYKNIGLTYGSYGKNQMAIHAYDTAYMLFQAIQDTNQMIKVLNNVGRQYSNLGHFEKAIEGYQKAENWMSVERDSLLWLILKFNHAACLSDAFEHEATLAMCDEIIPLALAMNNWYVQVEAYSLKGINYGDLKNYTAAEIAYQKAFDCIPKASFPTVSSAYVTNNPDIEASILNNRALLYLDAEYFEKAYTDLKLAIDILEDINTQHPNGEFYINLGVAAKGLKKWQESERYFQEGLQRLKQTHQLPYIGETYAYMADLYQQSGQGLLAYDYLKKSYQIQDSLLSATTKKNLQELNVKYETEKFKKNLADSQLKMQRQRYRFNLLIIGTISLFLLGLLAYFFYYSKQQRKLLHLEKQQIELQYGLLRAQMNPHFIFNALASMQGFFANHQFVKGNEFMGKFSRLIRQILDQSVLTVHSLSAELETLRLYLDIEKERMDGNLNYYIELADNVEEEMIELPPLIFQPFVENAIWHGISPKNDHGNIWITIQMNDETDELFCQIKDDGVGLQEDKSEFTKHHTSKGIQITRERLGKYGRFEIENTENERGVTVKIYLSIS